jgi:hypothetical protein
MANRWPVGWIWLKTDPLSDPWIVFATHKFPINKASILRFTQYFKILDQAQQ